MHQLTYSILETVRRKNVPIKDRAKAIELCVGETIACCLEIPTAPVAELNNYFLAHCKVKVMDQLSEVNEHTVIDMDRACNLVYVIWKMRYSLVHRPNDPTTGRLVIVAVNSNERSVPQVYRDIIRDYPEVALSRYEIQDIQEVEHE